MVQVNGQSQFEKAPYGLIIWLLTERGVELERAYFSDYVDGALVIASVGLKDPQNPDVDQHVISALGEGIPARAVVPTAGIGSTRLFCHVVLQKGGGTRYVIRSRTELDFGLSLSDTEVGIEFSKELCEDLVSLFDKEGLPLIMKPSQRFDS